MTSIWNWPRKRRFWAGLVALLVVFAGLYSGFFEDQLRCRLIDGYDPGGFVEIRVPQERFPEFVERIAAVAERHDQMAGRVDWPAGAAGIEHASTVLGMCSRFLLVHVDNPYEPDEFGVSMHYNPLKPRDKFDRVARDMRRTVISQFEIIDQDERYTELAATD